MAIVSFTLSPDGKILDRSLSTGEEGVDFMVKSESFPSAVPISSQNFFPSQIILNGFRTLQRFTLEMGWLGGVGMAQYLGIKSILMKYRDEILLPPICLSAYNGRKT